MKLIHQPQQGRYYKMQEFNISDYYFLRAFSEDKFAVDFLNGKVYMSAIANFKNKGNTAQKDESESILLRKQDGVRFRYIISKEKPTSSKNMREMKSIKYMSCDCYALCFFLIKKCDVLIENGELLFKENSKICEELPQFLKEYKDCRLLLIDAEKFTNIFDNYLSKSNIKFQKNKIMYCENPYKEKQKQFNIQQLEKLNFIKSIKYSNENEYRYIIRRKRISDDHMEFFLNDIESTVIWKGEYRNGEQK